MHRGLLLLLLRAAADDRVVLRQDTAVPLFVTRALPLDPGAAHRHLQSSSDACNYVSVSGSTAQTSRHGLYEATGTCESQPFFSCLDCGSDQFIWYTGTLWIIGNAGCGGTGGGIYIAAKSKSGATVVDGGGLGPQNWSSMLSTSVFHGLSPKKNAWAFPPVTGLASAPSTELQMPLSSPPLASLALSSTSAFIRYPVGMCSSS